MNMKQIWDSVSVNRFRKRLGLPPLPYENNDNVNHPSHYQGKVECIDALEAATADLQGLEAVCTANAIKYLWRWKKKNGVEDLKKARWYLDKLLEKAGEQV